MHDPSKVEAVVRAWTVEGRSPQYHRQQMERLKKEWPELYKALSELTGKR